jgi:hypothetical protein
MPSFSCRWGLPSCRRKADNRERCPGRRPGNAATCRARLKGWIRKVAERSPIWGDVDLKAFCATTGYSREHATRELSTLRREGGFIFETKLRSKRGSKTSWGVIVADPEKLLYDKRSLFYDRRGKRLHNYTTLAGGGEKIEPTIIFPVPERRPRGRPRTRPAVSEAQKRPRGRPRKQCSTPLPVKQPTAPISPLAPITAQVFPRENSPKKYPEISRRCDNPLTKDSFGIQQPDSYGASRRILLSRGEKESESVPSPLKKKAFSLQKRLESCHWDNCKVQFSNRAAHCYALGALVDGHEERRIISSYEQALFVCHGHAVDKAASSGKIVFFNPSSTIVKAAALLAKDGLERRERISRWYAARQTSAFRPNADPGELAAIRAQIAATFHRGN